MSISTTTGRAERPSGLMSLFGDMRELRRQRTALAHLDPHLLNDIGLTRSEARREASRPAWDVPRHWRR